MKVRLSRASSALPFAAVFAFSLFYPALSRATSILDIGTDYRIRGISYGRTDFGQSTGQNFSYYSQRALAHIGGRFSPNIEMMTQIQAIGFAGSSGTVVNPIVNPSAGRYPNTNFTPWVQWAYLKASQLYDLPIDITLGRQPMTFGDGLILSDDDLGFTGIRMQSRLPWYDLQGDAFTFRTADALQGAASSNIYGVQLTKPAHAIRYQLAWVVEQQNNGTVYVRPSENTSTGTLVDSDFTASHMTRSFYDARVEGKL